MLEYLKKSMYYHHFLNLGCNAKLKSAVSNLAPGGDTDSKRIIKVHPVFAYLKGLEGV